MASSTFAERRQLVLVFCAWKLLIFLLTALCPGPGYDTSGLILTDGSVTRYAHFESSNALSRFVLNLLRWDALYFVKAAERGVVFEQEWAFSPVFSRLVGVAGRLLSGNANTSISYYIATGIAISTICHLLSVLVLHRLTALLTGAGRQQGRIPFIACVLHIVTPASLFLSAPYAESLFSLLNLTGMLCYAESKVALSAISLGSREIGFRLSSGVLFALATTIRSNGLLSGLILLYDVVLQIPQLLSLRSTVYDISRVIVTCISGSLIAVGFVGPQLLAYMEFCGTESSIPRPWCERYIPSIYSWVQSHYWNVGLFRYWTLSNLPLFLLALPMLSLLVYSSVTTLRIGCTPPSEGRPVPGAGNKIGSEHTSLSQCKLPELALPQLVLALAAATSFHVQIINRIASGYPIWYLTVAGWLVNEQTGDRRQSGLGQWAVRAMIIYSMVQGVLFANFLPPA